MPADLAHIDAFWEKTLARLRATPMDATCQPHNEQAPYHCQRVTLRSLDDAPIVAYLAFPAAALIPGTKLPAIIMAPGYGGWEFGSVRGECQRGYIVLQVFPRMQGESGPAPKDAGHLLRGIAQPEGYFYQGAYCDLIRGVDYLCTRPEVDPQRIAFVGTSQGGGIALAVAALDPRIRVTVAHVPFLCHLRYPQRPQGMPQLSPAQLDTFDYFDPVNLARRIAGPTLMSSGGKDQTCFADAIRAVFDQLNGPKCLYHDPQLTHTSSAAFYRLTWEWLAQHL